MPRRTSGEPHTSQKKAIMTDDTSDPTANYLALLGSKWALSILNLNPQRRRFRDLKAAIPGVSQRMLAQTLRDLSEAGLIDRVVLSESTPRKVEYSITPQGRALFPILHQLQAWAMATKNETHASCQQETFSTAEYQAAPGFV